MKRVMRIKLFMLACATMFVFAAGCGKEKQNSKKSAIDSAKVNAPKVVKKKKIAVIPKGTTHPFWKSVEAGALKAGKDANFDVIWKGALVESDRGKQIQIIKQFITQKVDGIVLAPLDSKAPGIIRVIEEAGKAGIPVVIMDSSLSVKPGKDYVTFAATSNKEAGKLAGKKLSEIMGVKGKVVILRYMEGSASTENREAGCLEELRKHKDIEIIAQPFAAGNGTIADAMQRAVSMISVLEKADGVFCSNDPTTVGMLKALETKGLIGKIKFVGFDASRPSVQALKEGKIQALVAQDPFNMGYAAVNALDKHFKGEKVDVRIDTGAGILTPDNLDTEESKKLLKQAQ
jgi:ribose transport system substrate-binding protein